MMNQFCVKCNLSFIVEADIKAIDSLHLSTQDRQSINMSCIADGIPAPSKIYWFRNKTLLDPTLFRKIQIISTEVPGFRTNISHDIQGLRSTLIISEPLYSIDNGDYVCIANNMIGTIARITDPYKLNIIQCKLPYIIVVRHSILMIGNSTREMEFLSNFVSKTFKMRNVWVLM